MACDIIISWADEVLIGEDQSKHMHYYREVARRNGYKVADSIILPDRQIKSIKDPSKKMSKSLGDDHCIYIDDSLEDIKRKIQASPTTPEWIVELKKIASLVEIEYDSEHNWDSKKKLSQTLYDYLSSRIR